MGVLIGLAGVSADEEGDCNFTCKNGCGAVASKCTKCDYDEQNCTYKFGPCSGSVTWKNTGSCPNISPDENGVFNSNPM
jgi:hypothetical protein